MSKTEVLISSWKYYIQDGIASSLESYRSQLWTWRRGAIFFRKILLAV
jgi:hypothetical protein